MTEPYTLRYTVRGRPIPEGSTKAFPRKRADGSIGVAVSHDKSTELMDWRYRVARGYEEAGGVMLQGAVSVKVAFFFARPKSVSEKKRPHPTTKPDIDKTLRAVLDALTGLAYADDSQVVFIVASKRYSGDGSEGAIITVEGAV